MTSTPSNRRIVRKSVESALPKIAPKPKKPWDPNALWRNLATAARVAGALAIVGAGVFAAVGARRYVTTSPRFSLHDLRIEGGHRRSHDAIATMAGVAIGDNVVDLDLDQLRVKLEADPWIERATLTRKLPSSLSIEIVEREAAAIVALPAGLYLATSGGDLFKRVDEGDPNDLPVVTGIAAEEVGGDREAVAQLVRRALDLTAEIERSGVFGGRVEELSVDADGGISAIVGRKGVRLAFGRPPYRGKMRLAERVESELGRRGAKATAVFLDDEQHADRVVVRLVAGLPPAEVTIDAPAPTPIRVAAKGLKKEAQ